jgi:antitoxin ParD1/3/4
MPTRRISLPDELERFITKSLSSGRYENASEVVCAALRSLKREEQQYQTKLCNLQKAIDEGDASGIASGDVFARVRRKLLVRNR